MDKTPEQIPKPAPDLSWRTVDDGLVIVSPEGDVQALNGSGALVWQLLDGHNQIGDIVNSVLEQYEVSPEQANHDLQKFLNELTELGLIVWER